MNDELEWTWKEALEAYFQVLLSRHSSGPTIKHTKNSHVRIAGVPAEIRTELLPNIWQKRYRLSHTARSDGY
jgi:hypothetical protein